MFTIFIFIFSVRPLCQNGWWTGQYSYKRVYHGYASQHLYYL